VVGSCERGNIFSGSIKCGEFLNKLKKCWVFKKVSYKIVQSNTSLFNCLTLKSGYMFRSLGPSSGLNTIMTPIQVIIQVTFEISTVLHRVWSALLLY
jgi:hypothetical protein